MKRDMPDVLSPTIAALAARLKAIRQEAERAGLFFADCPLLQCPACALYEDVRIDGCLMTCFATDKTGVDTGLRFERVSRIRVALPVNTFWLLPSRS